jgi:hypothetical protein
MVYLHLLLIRRKVLIHSQHQDCDDDGVVRVDVFSADLRR